MLFYHIFLKIMNKHIFKLIHVVAGMWSTWEQWTQCSRTCGLGKKIRNRNCSSPAPENNGDYCVGLRSEVEPCLLEACTPGILKSYIANVNEINLLSPQH